jgi:hypothetical protein
MKYCKFCDCNKLKSEFSKDKIQKDRLKSKCKSCEKQYRQENKLKISIRMRLYSAQYRKENKSKRNSDKSKRRSAKLQRTPKWLNQEHLKQIETTYQIAVDLTNKTGVPHHVDHIIPLLGKAVSGLHVPWNLQVLTAVENQSKSNKF